jgi:hypothetical protein
LHPFPVQVLATLARVLEDLHELQVVQAAIGFDLGSLALEADTFAGLLVSGNSDVADSLDSFPPCPFYSLICIIWFN